MGYKKYQCRPLYCKSLFGEVPPVVFIKAPWIKILIKLPAAALKNAMDSQISSGNCMQTLS